MRNVIMIVMLLALAAPALAVDLGAARPDKPAAHHAAPPTDPDMIRQGGDTIADAVSIPVTNYVGTGTTVGYTDDYDEVCPYSQSTSPDVVYHLDHTGPAVVDIDMCGSSYDTKIYVYDENLALVACNDDFYFDDVCGMYVSRLEQVDLEAGVEYYLVIDGYGGDAGQYELAIDEWIGEEVECAYGSVLEGEPPLVNDYVDEHNGGCNTPGEPPFQPIASQLFCGQSGWYLVDGSSNYRDTDWFTLTMPATGQLVITGWATWGTYLYELGPQDCAQVGVLQEAHIQPLTEATLTITGEPGSTVWLWVGPDSFESPIDDYPYEYTYMLSIPQVVATRPHSWSAVKGLFD